MIQIYTSSIEDQGNEPNFILEIKALRTYLAERYGNAGGLKECKECIESVLTIQRVARTPIKVKRSDLETLRAMINDIDIISETTPRQRYILQDVIDRLNGMMLNNEL
jgi:hypothetical protein